MTGKLNMWKKDKLWISRDGVSGSSLGYLSFKKGNYEI